MSLVKKNGIIAASSGQVEASFRQKVGFFGRDTGDPSGDTIVTGVGFKPSLVLFFASISGTSKFSIGTDDGSASQCFYDDNPTVPGTYANINTKSIYLEFGTGNVNQGEVTSFDPDGFTVNFIKTGTPSGVASIMYLALG